ncbi:hypothetical protein [Rahnella bonaserana]
MINIKGIIAFSVIPIVLCSCANFQKMDTTLNMMKGKDKSIPFKILGYPDGSYKVDQDNVYLWTRSDDGVLALPAAYTSTAMESGRLVTTTSYNTAYVSTSYSCRIKIITDAEGIVKEYHYDGNESGCYPYIRKLWVAKKKGLLN